MYSYAKYMTIVNKIYYYLHFIFILPILFLMIYFLGKKQFAKFVIILIMAFLCYYYILVTGISFWQGDRLVLPSISIWTFLYIFVIYAVIQIFSRKPI